MLENSLPYILGYVLFVLFPQTTDAIYFPLINTPLDKYRREVGILPAVIKWPSYKDTINTCGITSVYQQKQVGWNTSHYVMILILFITEYMFLTISGDLFVLVYSIDNRESFEEVSKLCKQIHECKGQCRKESKRLVHVPMMIVGNKCDKDKHRVIDPSEPEMLKETFNHCGFLETSAKKNINVEESFQNLFDLAKLPAEMSPSLHRRVQPTYIGGNTSQSGKRGMSIRRKMSSACGTIAPNVRRPSIRTDLLEAQLRTNSSSAKVPPITEGQRSDSRCVIQ